MRDDAVARLNEALLAKAAGGKLLRMDKVRADTTVVETDSAATRAKVLGSLSVAATARHTARGRADTMRDIARANVVGEAVERVADWIDGKLKQKDGQTYSALYGDANSRDRTQFPAAIDLLVNTERVWVEQIVGPNGQAGRRLWRHQTE